MINLLFTIFRIVRAFLYRKFQPRSDYWIATRSLKPLSYKFGFDRGTPIDRYWIESFLNENRRCIQGTCLEVTDDNYTKTYGENKVKISDVLDINDKNQKANIHGDLRNLMGIVSDRTYDCIILTHVLGLIDDPDAAIAECYRILKPGGVLLLTSSCLGPILNEKVYWRFTAHSLHYLLNRYFPESGIQVQNYGNVLAGQCFWVGMSQEELSLTELKYVDPRYPCIVSAVVIKE